MANWLEFDKIQAWDGLCFVGFSYDDIADETIAEALVSPFLSTVDTHIDWEDDEVLTDNLEIPDEKKHAYRVAALVSAFQNGQPMQHAIELDTFSADQCCSCVPNGHHRVRALQYLGLTAGPFGLSGSVDSLEDLVRVAGCEPPPEAVQFVELHLLVKNDEDIDLGSSRKTIEESYGI